MKYFIHIFLLLFCISCAEKNKNILESKRAVHINITPHTEIASRIPGIDILNENKISNIYVFFYNAEGTECLYFPPAGEISITPPTITVNIPETADDILDRTLIIYVLANCNLPYSALSGKSLPELQSLTQENTASFNTGNTFVAQSDFLMDGKIEDAIIPSTGQANLPILELRRAAAKVVVNIINTDVTNYEAISARIRMNNYLDKTTLGNEAPFYAAQSNDYKNSLYRPVSIPSDINPKDSIFYSYANDWEYGPSLESYITMAILWRNLGTLDEKEYYYRIPFNYVPDDPQDIKKFRLRRNYIYGFNIDVSELGGVDPDQPVELTPHFTIRDWFNDSVKVELNLYDYLMVNERYIELHHNVNRNIQFVSSSDIHFENITTWYNRYEADGRIIPVTIPNPQINTENNLIKITFPDIPKNFVPRNLEFTVKNMGGLSQKVTVIQYPPLYITAELSTGNVGTDVGEIVPGNNHNLYTITTTRSESTDGYVIGDPARYVDGKLRTLDAEHTQNIVSPQFVVASQRGESRVGRDHAELWEDAVRRCQTYYEDPYPKGTWRLPTLGELKLMGQLHSNPNSALKNVFMGGGYGDGAHRYWASTEKIQSFWPQMNHYGMDMEINKAYHYAFSTTCKTRCVHDVWRK